MIWPSSRIPSAVIIRTFDMPFPATAPETLSSCVLIASSAKLEINPLTLERFPLDGNGDPDIALDLGFFFFLETDRLTGLCLLLAERKKDPRNRESSLGLLVSGLNVSKADLKKMEKLTNINIHLHALFAAVEFGQVEKARAILEDNEVDTNR